MKTEAGMIKMKKILLILNIIINIGFSWSGPFIFLKLINPAIVDSLFFKAWLFGLVLLSLITWFNAVSAFKKPEWKEELNDLIQSSDCLCALFYKIFAIICIF